MTTGNTSSFSLSARSWSLQEPLGAYTAELMVFMVGVIMGFYAVGIILSKLLVIKFGVRSHEEDTV